MGAIINIDVPDVDRAVEFYTAATGCRVGRRLDPDVAELLCGDVRLYLLKQPEHSAAAANPSGTRCYTRHWTPVHVDFVVADLPAAVARAERAGAIREGDPSTWRGATHVTFADPFGHGFCLIAFRNGTYE